MQLWKKLKNKPFCNDTHFFLIGVLLLLISFRFKIVFIFLAFYLLFIYKKIKMLYPVVIVISIFIVRILLDNLFTIDDLKDYQIRITETDDNGYDAYINFCKVRVSDYEHSYKPGDIICANIKIIDIDEKSYASDFDYELYLKSEGIKYYVEANEQEYIKSSFSIGLIKYNLLAFYKSKLSNDTFDYLSTIVFGQNNLDSSLKDGYSILGISHILAISGLHIMLLFKLLAFLILKLIGSYKETIPILIITIYVIAIGCPISAFRALLFLYIGQLNKKGSIQYTKLDILSIACMLMLLINPYSIYNRGFMLSYLVSFLIIFMNDFIKTKSKLVENYLSHYLIYFITLPIVISITNYISFFSLLLAPVLTIVVTYIVLPISYLVLVLPFLDFIFKHIFGFINSFVLGLNSASIGVPIMSFNFYTAIIYYILYLILLVMIAKRKGIIRYGVVFILYILVLINFRLINPIAKITFIDVGQGDSAIIELSNNRGIMVVDAFNSFDYLKSIGISKIDYLVLTHSDTDHIKDAIEIIDYFKVEKIICPKYDDGFKEYNPIYVDYNNSFILDDVKIDVLGPIKEYKDKNSNSIVLRFSINDYSFLFTGDMTIEEEMDLIDRYGYILDSDVLKVGHHGSISSSSKEFIEIVSPDYSIISAGRDNIYGHPDKEVYERLSSVSLVLQTINSGNISICIYKNKMWIDTYR